MSRHQQNFATICRVVVSTIPVETSLRLGLRLSGPPYVVKTRLLERASHANIGLPWNSRYGECLSGLSLTLAVMLTTLLAYLHASA